MKEEKLGKRVALSLVEVKKENTDASIGMSTGASSGTVTLGTTPTVSAYESRIPQQHVDQHLELSRLQHTTSSAGTGYAIHDFLSLYGGTPSRFIDPNSSRTPGAVCTQDFLQPMERAKNTENLQTEKLGHGRASGQASVGQILTPGINNPANDHAGNLAYWSNVQLKFGFPDLMASSRIPLVNAVDASQQPVASVSKQRVQGNRGLGELGKECEKTSEDDEDEDDYHEHSRDTKKQGSTSKGESMQRLNGKFLDEKELTFRSKHSATEQRRRSKINARFQRLRELVPHSDQKRDKASFLLEVIEYIQGLQDKVRIYETTGQVKQQVAWDISKMERDKRSGIGELPIEASSACTSVTGNLQLQKMNDAHRVFIMQRGAEPNRSGCTHEDIASNGTQGSQLLKSKLGGINVATSHDDKGAVTNPPLLSASLSLTREGTAQALTGQDQGNLIMAKRTFTVEENELLSLPEGKDRQTESSVFPKNGGGKGITEQFVADTLLPLAQEENNTPTLRKPEALQSRGDTLEDGTEQEPRSMISGVVSVSAAYSQGLLDTLTRALQGAGLDLSQAKISVRIDLGKSVGAPASLRGVAQSPESSPRSYQSQEHLKQSRSSPDSDRPSKKAKSENQ